MDAALASGAISARHAQVITRRVDSLPDAVIDLHADTVGSTLLEWSRRPSAGYSSTHRIFTEQQRLAITARDGGCSMPGCDASPAYCEIDHVTEWRHTRRTSVDDAALLCSAPTDTATARTKAGPAR